MLLAATNDIRFKDQRGAVQRGHSQISLLLFEVSSQWILGDNSRPNPTSIPLKVHPLKFPGLLKTDSSFR